MLISNSKVFLTFLDFNINFEFINKINNNVDDQFKDINELVEGSKEENRFVIIFR